MLDELERGRRNFSDITWLSSHRARFACFCKEQADNKQYAIEKFIEQENSLKAQIEEKEAKKVAALRSGVHSVFSSDGRDATGICLDVTELS